MPLARLHARLELTLDFRLLQAVLKSKEASTSAFCRQDEALASALVLKNGSKAMFMYQRFAVRWMAARERGRGRPLDLPVPLAPDAPAVVLSSHLPIARGMAAVASSSFDMRDGIGYSTQQLHLKSEILVTAPQQCVVSAYADALERLPPADVVNTRVSGVSVHRNPLWQRVPPELSCSCLQYYWNPATGQVCAPDLQDDREADLSPFGGLLCDEMGAGKVCTCASCCVRSLFAWRAIAHCSVCCRRCSVLRL
jgi:hypothetical protein